MIITAIAIIYFIGVVFGIKLAWENQMVDNPKFFDYALCILLALFSWMYVLIQKTKQ